MQRSQLLTSMQSYFEVPEVMQQIQEYMAKNHLTEDQLDTNTLVDMLDALNLLQRLNLIDTVQSTHTLEYTDTPLTTELSPHHKSLRLTLQGGTSFAAMVKSLHSTFVISVCFMKQRFQTKHIKCSTEPQINQTFEIRIDKANLKLEENRSIQVAVILHEGGNKSIYAIKDIEWRFVLAFGLMKFGIELPMYNDHNTSGGVLQVRLDLHPNSNKNLTSERLLNNQFQLEKKTKEKINDEFYELATQFWNDYKSIHPTFTKRSVPLYRESEDRIYVQVSKFLHPLYNVRGIDSPFHALRFVSLIPYEEDTLNLKSLCKRFHTFLSLGSGSVLDHCHLLCSLLLGFGLNVYICTGYSGKGEHCWVMELGKKELTVWEGMSGSRFLLDSEKGRFYKSIYSIYNHQQFYANIQMNEMMGAVTFDIKNENKWRSISTEKIQNLRPFNQQVFLLHPSINAYKLEEEIESQLTSDICAYRKEYKLETKTDERLKSILSIALSNYEHERITEQTFGEKEFQEAIKNYIPERHTFRAFPVQLQEKEPSKIMTILKSNRMSNDILLSRGDSVHLALKTKVIVYPDNLTVVWLSLASRYYKLL